MAIELPMTGGCACAAIRYECAVAPLFMFFCRCRGCQQATGSPYAANVWFPTPSVMFVKGEVKSHVIDAFTGKPSRHDFCGDCGSPIGMRADSYSEIRGIRAASFDDPYILKPTANVWLCSKVPWDNPDSSLLSYERNIQNDEIETIASKSTY